MEEEELEPLRGLYDWGKAREQNPDHAWQEVVVPLEMQLRMHGSPSYDDTDSWRVIA